MAAAAALGALLWASPGSLARVSALHRYPCKGLWFDELERVRLGEGDAFPADRRYALLRGARAREPGAGFDADDPRWVHKEFFFSAFSAGEALARLRTSFDDRTDQLAVRWRDEASRARGAPATLSVPLARPAGRAALARFLSAHVLGGEAVRVVCASPRAPREHQFGNTRAGVRSGSGDVRTVHLISRTSVADLAREIGAERLSVLRFRANVVVDELAPWAEMAWVGRTLRAERSGLELRVLGKTVRCAGIGYDPRAAAGDDGGSAAGSEPALPDLPALINEHFPEHGPYFGVYAQVTRAGELALGDVLAPVD